MTAASELIARRDLLINLTRAELSARYRSATLGIAWFVLTPLVLMVVLTLIFEHVIRLGIPDYPVFVFSGLLPWTFIQMTLLNTTTSVTRAPGLIKRVALPRVFLPLAAIGSNLIQYLVSLALLVPLMLAFDVPFQPTLVLLPAAIALAAVAVTGLSLIVAAVNVAHRDVEMMVSAGLRVLFYATPVFYPLSAVPEQFRLLYLLNPASGIVEIHRSLIIDGAVPSIEVLAMSAVTTVVVLILGIVVFRRRQQNFEDYL